MKEEIKELTLILSGMAAIICSANVNTLASESPRENLINRGDTN